MTRWLAAFTLAILSCTSVAWAACSNARRVEIFPTAHVLPENLLRLYVYFPYSMKLGQGIEIVRLLDATGEPVSGAFLKNREDLWSPDRRRLTLLLDPGRVKTGLNAHEALGRVLATGQSYRLEVSGAALGANGCALGQDTWRGFTVAAADFAPPEPSRWTLSRPRLSSTEPLKVALDGPYDHLSLAFRLRVFDASGNVVPGTISLGKGEESWQFKPKAVWEPQTYSLMIDERLEDLAGNRPGTLFDRPLNQPPSAWEKTLTFKPVP